MKQDEYTVLQDKCKDIRRLLVECIASRGSGHVGGSLSVVETLVVLYYKHMNIDPKNPKMEGRDRFVLSKGHAGPALYSVLADLGFFHKDHLLTLNRPGSILPSHCDMQRTPGIDMSTGSLGQGFSCAAGVALAAKMKQDGARVYAIIGDGETQEGQIWEAAMFAGSRKLDNFIAFTDSNKMQLDNLVEEINGIQSLEAKWSAFNWNVITVENGNDVEQVDQAVMAAKAYQGKPTMIILNTIKGCGAPFAEKAGLNNHSMSVTQQDVADTLAALA